ncbi:feruloyl esterase B precursor [Aspergillus heteromorphus CBS 117.55]|uniref:Carboxylic ester hydrolase n=1 Tax=Aspergillus heteromorphus CBS 117.55 TaxID=1448321 RepID=A0A317VLB5_9EURO|nr:feruloyl esterase B precursor [Aspergillus heteromorphus CBS 117.55]PWY75126.1 feruloyl esterase B precursor [Aspergillus heteromorphus CBS 117.55]
MLAWGVSATANNLTCSSSFFSSLIPSNATLNYVTHVPENGTFGDRWADTNATSLPEGCAVGVQVQSSNVSHYNIAMYLPSSWNTRFMATGNGGYGGFTAWHDMGRLAHYGFAVISTDTGHFSGQEDGKWAYNHPESIIDWAWRALHGSVVIGKDLTASYYGQTAQYSYYTGCSTGGRQGLKEIQEFPEDFDGVLIGSPAWWMTHLAPFIAWFGAQNLPINSSHHLEQSHLAAVRAEVFRQCDPQDGVTDQIIMDPRGCDFRLEGILCNSSSNSSSCLNPAQMETARRLISPWVDVNATWVFPTFSLGAALHMASGASPNTLGTDWIQYWILNQTESIDWKTLNYYDVVQLADSINPGGNVPNQYNMSEFQQRGGKLLHYHGHADQIVPTEESRYFYEQVDQAFAQSDVDLDDFYRFFYIPGMGHCSSSEYAPWYIAGPTQYLNDNSTSVPGYEDRYHDSVLALVAWTENDEAPDYLIATKYKDDTVSQGVEIQRPVCPFPKKARYTGGEVTSATSWECA